jgi:type IV secretion system protein VirD4
MIRSAAGLIGAGIHHPYLPLTFFALIVFAVMFYRRVLSRSAQIRRRTRALRWRIRLRLRPGAGFASLPELVFRWSRLAALGHGRRARPSLGLWLRLVTRTTGYAVRVGRAQYWRRIFVRMEDQTLVFAPQRTGKSGLIADRLLDHPGAALVTSTRLDLYHLTAAWRSRLGPPELFNPQGIGGLPSTFAWDILEPCTDVVMARRIAGWLTSAVGGSGNKGNIEWFEKKGDVALASLLFAAAVSGRTITDVYRWVQLDGHEMALNVLRNHPDSTPEMLAVVKRALDKDSRTSGSVRDTMDLSLSWAVIPQLAAAATPAQGAGFDIRRFLSQRGTLYMIASGDEDSPLTPLFSAFVSFVHYAAGLEGSLARHGRLDPPLWLGLDEVTTICPVALPVMLSDSAGKGILITAVAHGMSQLEERWGEHGGKTVWACCGTKIILQGVSDAAMLEDLSALCGTVKLGADDGESVRVVPSDLIRTLPDWRALVIRMNLFPVVVKIRPAWKRRKIRRFTRRAGAYVPPARSGLAELLPDLAITEPGPALDAHGAFDELSTEETPAAFPFAGGVPAGFSQTGKRKP